MVLVFMPTLTDRSETLDVLMGRAGRCYPESNLKVLLSDTIQKLHTCIMHVLSWKAGWGGHTLGRRNHGIVEIERKIIRCNILVVVPAALLS